MEMDFFYHFTLTLKATTYTACRYVVSKFWKHLIYWKQEAMLESTCNYRYHKCDNWPWRDFIWRVFTLSWQPLCI